MHFKNPRRSTPSLLKLSLMKSPIAPLSPRRAARISSASDRVHLSRHPKPPKYSRDIVQTRPIQPTPFEVRFGQKFRLFVWYLKRADSGLQFIQKGEVSGSVFLAH